MKQTIVNICGLLIAATLISGCGKSEPETKPTEQTANAAPAKEPSAKPSLAPAAAPVPAVPNTVTPPPAAATVTAPATRPAPPEVAARVDTAPATPPVSPAAPPTATTKVTDAAAQLVTASKAQGDKVLSSLSADLTNKVNALTDSAGGNSALKSQLTSSLQSLAAGKDATGLTSMYQVAQSANLTPTQVQLAKDVGNLASAYVVQKNFATLDGAQNDVATIVSSLRQGQVAPAVPALQKVAQNASLTAPQKELMASIADKYAPGVSKATGLLQQGLHSIPGFGGSGK